ncbi:MAG: hypothetical protein KME30_32700 [Iphinoe sp. HA4291-MV1]|jgi:thioesterase domain-containing protein|nr:hypothetical protein [Iphinoe sp. HA4291-MV1]
MAADYIQALQIVQPQGPYLLGGHSFGGYVAFEMATQLHKQGQDVAMLAIMDTSALIPDNKRKELDPNDAKHLTELVFGLERLFGKNLSISYEDLQPLEPDKQLNYILERLKTVNIFSPDAQLSQIRGILQCIKASLEADYLPQEVYPNQITVLRSSEQQLSDDPTMGWDKFSSKPIQNYDVPGDHITMVSEPHVQVLAQQLTICIEQAQADD